jgi:hypothetical protein
MHPADAGNSQASVQAVISARFPAIAGARAAALPTIGELDRRLLVEDAAGVDNARLRQAVREWRWRLEYTGDAAAADAARDRALRLAASPAAARGGTEVWFLKLDALIDDLLTPDCRSVADDLLGRVNEPAALQAYLDSILVSRPEVDGVDRRKELNLSTANLVRLVLWRLPRGYAWDRRLEEVIRGFIAAWQDPVTGFFGPRYEIAGRRFQTADLSITFHIARYLGGGIGHWRQLIDTLLAIRDRRYPGGWLDDDGLTAHNAYDVVTLLRLGWPHMDDAQRSSARLELARLTEWCMMAAIGPEGVIGRGRGEALPESCYFTISLLDALGFFEAAPFWRHQPFTEAAQLRPLLSTQLNRLAPSHAMTRMAIERLAKAGAATGVSSWRQRRRPC